MGLRGLGLREGERGWRKEVKGRKSGLRVLGVEGRGKVLEEGG